MFEAIFFTLVLIGAAYSVFWMLYGDLPPEIPDNTEETSDDDHPIF